MYITNLFIYGKHCLMGRLILQQKTLGRIAIILIMNTCL